MVKSKYRPPKGGMTPIGKTLLRLRFEDGVPKKQLAREFNISVKYVRQYLKAKETNKTKIFTPKKNILRRRKKIVTIISPKDLAGVPKHSSARCIAGRLSKKGVHVTKRTVQRDLKAMKYTYSPRPVTMALTERQKAKRVEFALAWNGDSRIIVFSDEKIIDTNDMPKKIWVAPGEKAAPRQKMR